MPDSVEKCIASWRRYCPDYEIIRWDETNFDVDSLPFTKQAYDNKKYAYVSDYARLHIIYREGGIYLDTDVELIKSLDDLLSLDGFLGLEEISRVNTGLGFGMVAGHPFLEQNMSFYHSWTPENNFPTCVTVTSSLLEGLGLLPQDTKQEIDGVVILPTDYLCPRSYFGNPDRFTDNTYSIHHYDETWLSRKDKLLIYYYDHLQSTMIGKIVSGIKKGLSACKRQLEKK
ncbi:glycosyltransferase family 32 protein [Streptococcus saliviloxodontae]